MDLDTAAQIALKEHPAEAKRLAKHIRDPNGEKPARNVEKETEIMKKALRVKFQDPFLKEFLLATKPKQLVECNQWDKVFGAGVPLSSPNFHIKSQHPGSNLLGQILMEIRQSLDK